MKPKVLLLDQADFIGGAELFNLDLINNLNQEKFDIHLLFSGNPDYQKIINKHIKEYVYPLPKLKNKFFKYFHLFKSAWLVRTIVKKEKIDLIQTNTIRTHIIAAVAKKFFKLDVKLVWFLHDFTFPENVLKKLINIPELIFTCSKTVKKDLIQKTDKTYSDKIKIAYNGVILRNINKENKSAKVLHNFLKSGTTKDVNKKSKIGIIGRLDPWKGQDVFIQAAAKVLEQNQQVEFVIIGSSSEYDEQTLKFEKQLHKLVQELKLENSVKFLGHVEDLDHEMQKLDLVIHASKKEEPFGRVIIEAMNWGKVVIASDLGGPREIIDDGKDGYLVRANDVDSLFNKVLEILKDENEMARVGEYAREKVGEKFELKKQVRGIEEVWKKLISSG